MVQRLERHAIVSIQPNESIPKRASEHTSIDSTSQFSAKSLYFDRDKSKPVRFHTKANIRYEELSAG